MQRLGDPNDRKAIFDVAGIYREHVGLVWRVLRRLGIPRDELDDAVHDVFLVLHRRFDDYDGRAAMTTWLFGIARGIARNYRRSDARTRRKLAVLPNAPSLQVEPSAPDAVLERERAIAAVDEFLAELDEDQRIAFMLVDIEGWSVPEVARACGDNLNTIYTRLRVARARFRAFVSERLERRTKEVAHAGR